ncbi:DUF2950 domain-containing protein [Bradyrhizobium sp.]|uniref:DUF2950 domain-containing protein n=1 Tax=Bradyrhizobium sp. TaxID=376 RepID=UPI00238FCB63|nr:DUF2950 domain-containing protein [Bradyrhizobium sp.]MDE2377604.1 DUF2950 domain-containing protein [Bradyrhizobium sp.]
MTMFNSLHRGALPGFIALALLTSAAQAQQSFSSPDEAAAALAAAAKGGSGSAIVKVLGKDAEDIVSSGDEVADAETLKRFNAAYDARHSIKTEGDRKATLLLGNDDFPFPIPLFKTRSGWEFDTAEGRREILYRRIGRNELDAIQTCLAYVDAQTEYAEKDRGDGVGAYAQRFISSPGKKDGLFWRDGEPSPLGEFEARASDEGYKLEGKGAPYHGYYFRILKAQGSDAPGGALNYVVKGKMIGGFALIAWPAEYGNSGVMTFLVNHAGVVYQKDLGGRTDFVAKRTIQFDPDQTWKKVDAAKP